MRGSLFRGAHGRGHSTAVVVLSQRRGLGTGCQAKRDAGLGGVSGKRGPGLGPVPARVCKDTYGTGELLKRGDSAFVSLSWNQAQPNPKSAFSERMLMTSP